MKKTFMVMALLLLPAAINAQFIKAIGFKAGGMVSQYKYEYKINGVYENNDPDNYTAVNYGIYGEFFNLPLVSVLAEINYVEKGARMKVPITDAQHPDGTGQFSTLKFENDYLNISLLAKVRLESSICTPYVFLGPKVDYELKRSGEYASFVNEADYNKLRFGFKTGIGTEVKIFAIHLFAEVVYDKDLGYLYNSTALRITSSAADFRGGFFINL